VSEYERPTATYIGLVGPNGELPVAASDPTYQIGDYVWARNTPDTTATRWLGHIESAHSVRSTSGRRWLVRVRRREFWTSGPIHMHIDGKLTTAEVLEHRRTGLIPPAGEQPR
jgi:hypothetical protein